MTGCTVDSQKSFLFDIIWSLQMPLFILISEFVTKYSRPISDGKGLWKYVNRRTVAYMLPWAVWSFLVRGMSDSGFAIILRAATSLAGCIAVCGLCKGIFSSKIGGGLLRGSESTRWKCTSHTTLSLIKLDKAPILYSPVGLGMVLANYMITVALTVMAIVMVTQNAVLRFVLTGKKK